MNGTRLLAVICSGALVLLAPQAANANLLAAVNFPGNCGISAPVQMFDFMGTGPLTELTAIPATVVSAPTFVVFSPTRELFVSNCSPSSPINRFLVDAAGNTTANGTITDPHLANAHGLAQSQWGELFAANFDSGAIVRFTFAGGAGTFNGTIASGGTSLEGLAFSPQQELFATTYSAVYRFTFGPSPTYAATPNGGFAIPGAGRLHGIAFSAWGELFVADADTNNVYRYTFDATGAPIAGTPVMLTAPAAGSLAVAFSNSGELFAASHSGALSRFTFDSHCSPVPNGVTVLPPLAGIDSYPRSIDSITHPFVPGCSTRITDAGLDSGADSGSQDDVADVTSPDVHAVSDARNDGVSSPDAGHPMNGGGCNCRIGPSNHRSPARLGWPVVAVLLVLRRRRSHGVV